MSVNDSNPFSRLVRDFSERARQNKLADDREAHGDARMSRRTPLSGSPASAGRSADRAFAMFDDAGDAALFLDAVSRIRRLPAKKRGRGEQALAQSLASKMKETAGASPFAAQDRKGRRKTGGARRPDAEPFAQGVSGGREALPPKVEEADSGTNFAALLDMRERRHAPGLGAEEKALFSKAMQGVTPVGGKGRDIAAPVEPARGAAGVDPSQALRDVLEGRVEFALHHTGEYMEGYVTGVNPLIMARLRAGQYSPEAHVDLHGMNARQAYDALALFMKNAYQRSLRTVVVVTGRGRNSPDGIGVLRGLLQRWLCREPFKRVVLAFCTARPGDGGPGAAYVLLRKYKKNRGKIIWGHVPTEDEFFDV